MSDQPETPPTDPKPTPTPEPKHEEAMPWQTLAQAINDLPGKIAEAVKPPAPQAPQAPEPEPEPEPAPDLVATEPEPEPAPPTRQELRRRKLWGGG